MYADVAETPMIWNWPGRIPTEGARPEQMLRDARFKLVLRDNGGGPGELYDWRADPLEHVNQYDNAAFITTRAAMTKQLRAWREKYV